LPCKAVFVGAPFKPADDASIDARARETEAKMTDDERFALLVSLIGAVPSIGVKGAGRSVGL
jgi:hypothetical protein